ncbi:testis-expressed protein 264 [Denticeps clupeoides]|uniref:Testis-expressed sequence 264 protein n=1 Tax=Denticeps clupeoides TaxID=299321 RepID=A0AAY4DYU6_9TELE|nr:testis-expressed protein 264 [Denticeps clupeoides]
MSDLLILALILVLVLSLIVTVGALVVYSGLLSSVTIRTGSPPIRKITIAYKFKEAPYKDSGATFTEACSIGPKLRCIGVFYDCPKDSVSSDKCRYAVGSILSEGEEQPDDELQRLYEKFGFSVISFPEVDHAVEAIFPNRSPLSAMMATYRVYPELASYIMERKLCAFPYMEIYAENAIHYVCPLARQNSFLVPEVRQAEKREDESDEDRRTDVTGADSNSESSYKSHDVQSESRETSLAPSSAPSVRDQDNRDDPSERGEHSDRGSSGSVASGSSFEELGLELDEDDHREEEEEEAPPKTTADGSQSVAGGEE